MIRVFARKTKWTPTDELAFYDEPPLFDLPDLPVRVNCVFTRDKERAIKLSKAWSRRFKDVLCGGPAFDDAGGEYIPGRFLTKAVTITSRGCYKNCPWCYVPRREGKIRELTIRDGWVVQDNNLLACSRKHIEKVFEMLSMQPIPASFPGGLDLDLVEPWNIDLLRELQKQHKLATIWVAFDTEQSLDKLSRAKEMFGGFNIGRRFAYVLIGYKDDTLDRAKSRLERVYEGERGFLPFAMLHDQNTDYEWKKLQTKWCRPAAYRKPSTSGN